MSTERAFDVCVPRNGNTWCTQCGPADDAAPPLVALRNPEDYGFAYYCLTCMRAAVAALERALQVQHQPPG